MKFLDLFKWTEEGVALIANFSWSGRVVHLAVVDVDHMFHVGDEFLLGFHQLLDDGPSDKTERQLDVTQTGIANQASSRPSTPFPRVPDQSADANPSPDDEEQLNHQQLFRLKGMTGFNRLQIMYNYSLLAAGSTAE